MVMNDNRESGLEYLCGFIGDESMFSISNAISYDGDGSRKISKDSNVEIGLM